MSDETTLLPCPFCGGEARHYAPGPIEHHIECTNPKCYAVTHGWSTEAEAIAAWNARATLGSEPPYDALLRCLENDWHISASWDGLRKFWCIELTEDGVRLRDATHGTLTAEQVREAIEHHGTASLGCRWQFNDRNLQAIADELNAALCGGECEWTLKEKWPNRTGDDHVYGYETGCGARHTWWPDSLPNFCPTCGGKVKVVDV